MANITVRRATLDDYEAVVEINKNVYSGADYVIYAYKELVTDPDCRYYVCEVDGEVGAFEGVFLLDDNNTLMSRSARVKEKFQGQGLLRFIRKKIYQDYKDVPGQKRIRTVCTNTARLVESSRFLSQNKMIGQKIVKSFQTGKNLKFPELDSKTISDVSELDLEQLSMAFKSKKFIDYAFPSGVVPIKFWFFDPLVSNIRHIRKQNIYMSISGSLKINLSQLVKHSFSSVISGVCVQNEKDTKGDDQEKSCFSCDPTNFKRSSDMTKTMPEASCLIADTENPPEDVKMEGLMSVTGHYFTPTLLACVINIFGQPRVEQRENDIRDIVYHSVKHAISLCDKHHHKVELRLTFIMDDNLEIYDNILERLGFQQEDLRQNLNKVYFFEQSFELLND